MNKSVIALIVIAAAAGGGLYYANMQAENAIKQQVEQANQSYRDLAGTGEMPSISLSYSDVSANVLTSSYSISGLEVSIAELGKIATVERITAKGIKPQSLADKGSMQMVGAKATPAILQMLPPQTAEFVESLALHSDYSYEYKDNGELLFRQDMRINDEFSLNYNFTLAQMQQFWQYAKEISAKSAEEQQALVNSPEYIEQMLAKLVSGALSNGAVVIENKGFIERVLAMTSQQGQTPDFKTVQGMALMNISMLEPLPQQMKDSLTTFVQQPEKLRLDFGFKQPLTFEEVQSGAIVAELGSPEEMIEFANIKLTAN
ncbi:hypothetical protein ORJ04_17975 [Rheinheimera baltica]|uniref:DUF945 domain-containing protein n=1 Tax=Rheinheimera baltica TaxID=67576 RepID=A0ABT9I376_9GAMM|nr:hypothetical protein [Rheinheimera baltica]MDP5137845.1 hypothetical protein [Rheinheimera baltica]